MGFGSGGKRLGAGRKPNALKGLGFDVIAETWPLHKQKTFWYSMLYSSNERISFEAGKYLTDRMYGKAKQEVDVNHGVSDSLALRIKEGRERARRARNQDLGILG